MILSTPNIGKSDIRVSLGYIKSLLRSKNTDKIKALLDIKIPISIIRLLNINDIHIKHDILDILLEISYGLIIHNNSNNSNSDNRNIEESAKNFGIVGHITTIKEDHINKGRFLEASNDFYSFK